MQTKRVPLTGVPNTRPGTGALTGSLGIFGIGVFGLAVFGRANSGSSKDHRLLNCFQITETDENARSKRLYVTPRPGFVALNTPRSGHVGNAIKIWTGQGTGTKVMSAFGNTNFTLYDGTTSKGSGTGKATGITETSVAGTATLVISSADSTAWYYQDGGSVTQITDVDFPGNASRTLAGTFAHLDGYAFIMDSTGRVYNSDVNSVTAWTANSYVTANSVPDVGVGCVRHRNTVVAFCKTHFDVFRNAGNPSLSPLSRAEELSQLIGCVNADAITTLRDAVFFVGATNGGNLALYSYNGGQVQKHSNAEVEAALAIAGPSNISITTIGFYGRHFIVICAASAAHVYCVEENNWHEWTGNQLWFKADAVVSGASIITYAISNDVTTGKVYVLNPASVAYADDGVTIYGTIQTTKLDFGTARRKFWHEIRVVGDQTTSAQTLSLYWSDDDYQNNSSTARSIDVSVANPKTTKCGASRRRSFFIVLPATSWRMEALEIDFEAGVN